MHSYSEESAHKAQEVTSLVTSIFLKLDRENAAVNEFLSEAMMLSGLVDQLCTTKEQVDKLDGCFRELESMLVQLENVCEELQQQKNTVEHEYQLTKYRQCKHMELEKTKVELARKHSTKVRACEEQLNKTLRERQKVFEEAFREQMQNYRRDGKLETVQLPHVVPTSSASQSVDLADIAVEDDTTLLDNFLNSSETKTDELPVDASTTSDVTAEESRAQLEQVADSAESSDSVQFDANDLVADCDENQTSEQLMASDKTTESVADNL